MLHKDEYNQDEYNDYYAQETRGAEISGQKNNNNSSNKLLIIVILLTLILIGGYFGWKNINSSKNLDTKKNNNINISKDIKSTENKENNITKKVTETINENNINSKMSPEDIANIVQIVMKKISEQNSNENKIEKPKNNNLIKTKEQIKDNRLMKSLKNSEVDSLISELEDSNISQEDNNKKAKSKKTIDTYNKKIVSSEKLANDDLSKLSSDISDIVENNKDTIEDKNSTEYAKKIKEETKERKKEMRYIIVKKGDTLGKIAKRVYGNVMMYKKIYEANPDILRRPDKIYIGQRLRVPE